MVREIALGNGSLLVNIDSDLRIRDIYFPYAGLENHVLGTPQRISFNIDGDFSWLSDWETEPRYSPGTIISNSSAKNQNNNVTAEIESCVHCTKNVFLRKIKLQNNSDRRKRIEANFEQNFNLYGNNVGDTAAYRPDYDAMVHYKDRRYIAADVTSPDEEVKTSSSYGIYSGDPEQDIRRGGVNGNPVAQGDIRSVISLKTSLGADEETCLYYRLNAGKSFEQCLERPGENLRPQKLFSQTEMCWKGYLGRMNFDTSSLPSDLEGLFKRSILVILGQTNENGSITAANDSTNLEFNQDRYGYVWPRDSAFTVAAMSRAGYGRYVKQFFDFIGECIEDEGYLLHKYNPNGSLGSSWHKWVDSNGDKRLPIQEDETALPLWALKKYYEHTGDKDTLKQAWRSFGRDAAEFLYSYFDEKENLPKPSYDLWEERYYTSTFTVSTVHAALKSASQISAELGYKERKYLDRAKQIEQEGLPLLRSENSKRYVRGLKDGSMIDEVSPSLLFLQKFGLCDRDDPYFQNTLNAVRYDLTNDEVGGIARYKGDQYHFAGGEQSDIPGNPWTLCTAWLARTLSEDQRSEEDIKAAKDKLKWIEKHSVETGLLSEQVNPRTGEPLSVAPLTWSHAAFIDASISLSQEKS